jgi:putative peptidoglycan lipid II flippase
MATTSEKQDVDKLGKNSFAAILGVLLSRGSGVIRTFVVNASFGAGVTLDAFYAAFRFPNALRDLFADGALSAAFIKSLVEERAKGIEHERKLISVTLGFFFVVTMLIAILLATFSYSFMELIIDQKFKSTDGLFLSSNLFKILAFYLPFTMLNAVAMATLNVIGNTFRAMNGSLFLSVGMILGSLLLGPAFEYMGINAIFGLATGSMIGIALQMVYQFQPLIPLGLLSFPNFSLKVWMSYKPLHEMLRLMAPRALGQGALTIALMINTFFAIRVGHGVLTYIVTAVTIIQVPIGLFGVASGFAAQPILTKAIHEGQTQKFSKLLVESLNSSLWLALLTTGAFALLIVPFYNVLFQHGKITYFDNIQNSIAVCAYATGILFSAGSKVLLNAFYSINVTKQTVYNAVVYLILSATLSSILAPKFGMIGLGISYGVSTMADFFINLYFLRKIYMSRYASDSPYQQGGNSFGLRLAIMAVFSFLLPCLGIESIQIFWKKFEFYFHVKLSLMHSLAILSAGGIFYGAFCILIIHFYGSESLRALLLKLRKLK